MRILNDKSKVSINTDAIAAFPFRLENPPRCRFQAGGRLVKRSVQLKLRSERQPAPPGSAVPVYRVERASARGRAAERAALGRARDPQDVSLTERSSSITLRLLSLALCSSDLAGNGRGRS